MLVWTCRCYISQELLQARLRRACIGQWLPAIVQAAMHTFLRLATGIFYSQGAKANVLFFDRKVAAQKTVDANLPILASS